MMLTIEGYALKPHRVIFLENGERAEAGTEEKEEEEEEAKQGELFPSLWNGDQKCASSKLYAAKQPTPYSRILETLIFLNKGHAEEFAQMLYALRIADGFRFSVVKSEYTECELRQRGVTITREIEVDAWMCKGAGEEGAAADAGENANAARPSAMDSLDPEPLWIEEPDVLNFMSPFCPDAKEVSLSVSAGSTSMDLLYTFEEQLQQYKEKSAPC